MVKPLVFMVRVEDLTAAMFVLAFALAGCDNASPKTSLDLQFLWVLDAPSPDHDLYITIDGERHALPIVFEFAVDAGSSGSMRIERDGDTRVVGSADSLTFIIESDSGEPLSWLADLKYDLSTTPIQGLKYSAFFYQSETDFIRDQWTQPTAESLITQIETNKLHTVMIGADQTNSN